MKVSDGDGVKPQGLGDAMTPPPEPDFMTYRKARQSTDRSFTQILHFSFSSFGGAPRSGFAKIEKKQINTRTIPKTRFGLHRPLSGRRERLRSADLSSPSWHDQCDLRLFSSPRPD